MSKRKMPSYLQSLDDARDDASKGACERVDKSQPWWRWWRSLSPDMRAVKLQALWEVEGEPRPGQLIGDYDDNW